MRVKPFLDANLDAVGRFAEGHWRCRHGLGHQKLDSQEEQEDEAEQFHRGFYIALGKERGKTRKSDKAVNNLHSRRPKANEHRPKEAAAGAFVQYCKIDGSDRDAK